MEGQKEKKTEKLLENHSGQ